MYEEASNSTILMLLNTAVYPFLAALVVSLIAGKLLRGSSYLGYIGGFLFGLSLIHSGLSFPPKQAVDYYIISAVIGIAAYLSLTNIRSKAISISFVFILFSLSFYLLLNPVLKHSGQLGSISWAVISGVITLFYVMLSTTEQKTTYLSKDNQNVNQLLPTVGLMIVAGSAAPVVSIGGSLLLGQLIGAFGAAIFAYCAVAFLTKTYQIKHVIPAALILGGIIAQSHVLADIPFLVIGMIAATCFVTPITFLLTSNSSVKKQLVVTLASQVVISGIVGGINMWLVWPESSLY